MFRLASSYRTIPKIREVFGVVVCALFLLFSLICPADAQYYPYGNSASMLLWPLTAASYQLFGGSGYLLGNLLMRGSYSPYGYAPYAGNYGPNYYGYPQNTGPFGYNSGQYPNNAYGYGYNSQPPYGQTLTGQGTPNQWPNQNAYQQAPNQQAANQQAPNQQMPNQWNNGQTNSGNNSANNSTNNPVNNQGINPATGRSTAYGSTNSYAGGSPPPPSNGAIASAPERPGERAPSPGVFIKFVNEKYNGDIYKALRDKELYSWAESLNLAGPNNGYNHLLSPNKSRRETIAKVLKDSTINPTYKIEILQILMRP